MRKHICVLAVLAALLMLSACGGRSPSGPSGSGSAEDPSAVVYAIRGGDGNEICSVTAPASLDGDVSRDGQKLVFRDAEASLEFRFISGDTDSFALAPSFLNDYLDYTDIEFSGKEPVCDALYLEGETITASGGGRTVRAYLIDVVGGVLAVVEEPAGGDGFTGSLSGVLNSLVLN
ncbi:MAG: hypothetical protein J5569_04925 [Oscillospiraceae bacterium]|nr:hypothetical protein [Oscillospiraceae bacterium]